MESFKTLERKYLDAKSALPKITYRDPENFDFYPTYPVEILNYIDFLRSSGWAKMEYDRFQAERTLGNMKDATLDEVRNCLAWFVTIERFVMCGWKVHLENGHVDACISRCRELVNEE